MRPLTFISEYLDQIAAGQKTQTIRRFKKPPAYKVGGLVTATNYKRIIKVKILSAANVHCRDLKIKHAKAGGFSSVPQLHKALKDIYGTINFVATVIEFEKA